MSFLPGFLFVSERRTSFRNDRSLIFLCRMCRVLGRLDDQGYQSGWHDRQVICGKGYAVFQAAGVGRISPVPFTV